MVTTSEEEKEDLHVYIINSESEGRRRGWGNSVVICPDPHIYFGQQEGLVFLKQFLGCAELAC